MRFDGPVNASNRDALERFIKSCAASVMHLDASRPGPRERFTDLGIDSLWPCNCTPFFGDGLGCREQLPATIAFDTGTVEGFTGEIPRLVEFAPDIPAASRVAATNMRSSGLLTTDELEAISDDDVEALLAQRISTKHVVTDQ